MMQTIVCYSYKSCLFFYLLLKSMIAWCFKAHQMVKQMDEVYLQTQLLFVYFLTRIFYGLPRRPEYDELICGILKSPLLHSLTLDLFQVNVQLNLYALCF